MRCHPEHYSLRKHTQITGLAQTKTSRQGKESHRARVKKN